MYMYCQHIHAVCVCVCVCVSQEQWGHMEEIELLNDGSGLGFGIVGGKAAGVVVRTLVPNSVADKVCFSVLHPHLTALNPPAQSS